MKLVKNNEKGKVYEGGDLKVFYREKGSISGDNDVNLHEKIYLINGEAKLTLENNTEKIIAPAEVEIPEKTYHKIVAITDITFVLLNN